MLIPHISLHDQLVLSAVYGAVLSLFVGVYLNKPWWEKRGWMKYRVIFLIISIIMTIPVIVMFLYAFISMLYFKFEEIFF